MNTQGLNQPAVNAVAWAIFFYEGGNKHDPHTRNVRNNNPGNLRPFDIHQPVDKDGYRIFYSPDIGWGNLVMDVESKVRRHLTLDQTMLDFFNIYAPGADHNDPGSYAQYVLQWLNNALSKTYGLTSTVGEIFFNGV